jgi:predicted MFS family arabinose efflux permease
VFLLRLRDQRDSRIHEKASRSTRLFTVKSGTAKAALQFVLLIGVVNLFADLTYEGGRGIAGEFLEALGATATAVGFIAGFGELVGYGLRSVSGYFADRTARYWLVAFVGYAINMLAVPALALAGNWPVAAALIVAERTGRAIRKPSVDSMLSHAGESIGAGWVFGLNEALDQAGATIGPLVVALVLYLRGTYQHAFAVLLGSALLCLGTLAVARICHPRPHELETKAACEFEEKTFSPAFWIYLVAGAFIAAGFADFSLIAFHFQKAHVLSESAVPVFYSVAMGTGALSGLVFGRAYDKMGTPIMALVFFVGALFAPLVFLGKPALALVGMVLWGIGLGGQDALLKAALTRIIPPHKRSTGFGFFDTGFGVAWFVGSALMGFLYDRSIVAVVVFSMVSQLAALPAIFLASWRSATNRGE